MVVADEPAKSLLLEKGRLSLPLAFPPMAPSGSFDGMIPMTFPVIFGGTVVNFARPPSSQLWDCEPFLVSALLLSLIKADDPLSLPPLLSSSLALPAALSLIYISIYIYVP